RRAIQQKYNEENGITPQSIKKSVTDILSTIYEADYYTVPLETVNEDLDVPPEKISSTITALDREMKEAAKNLEYETAAKKRDQIKRLRELEIKYLGSPKETPQQNG
ncbi:MAG: UvrB/UvrC motif-containing protein, partial [Candidatus Dadabacteria bacterium]